jgi:ATP-dependent Lon protease
VALRDSGVKNPVVLLDEIDKLQVRNSDPSAALLEVLDPEQNNYFVDKYLEIPFDLSQVFFICTANDLDFVSAPLKDRMDVITFRSYEVEERLKIVKDFMIPKALADYNMSELDINWDQDWINLICTQESQLRQLDMKIRKVLRKWLFNYKLGKENDIFLGRQTDSSTGNSSRRPIGFF